MCVFLFWLIILRPGVMIDIYIKREIVFSASTIVLSNLFIPDVFWCSGISQGVFRKKPG